MANRFIYLVSSVAALGGLLFGFDTAIISGAIPALTAFFKLDASSLGFTVSSVLIGCALGALLAGIAANTLGRKGVLVICAAFFAISGIGAGLATQLTVFVLFRIIGGLGVGGAAMVSPMYIAEVAPAAQRGKLVSLYQLAIVSGILGAYFTGYWLESNWRAMFLAQAAPSLLFLVLLLIVPETPRWLYAKGQEKQAITVLRRVDPGSAESELEAIRASFDDDHTSGVRPVQRRIIWYGIGLAIFQQVTGINAILYYAPIIFKQTGLDQSHALLQTVAIGAVNVLAAILAMTLSDKLGRRKLLLSGSVLMGLTLLAIAGCFQYQLQITWLLPLLLLCYVAAFGCTLGAVTWVYLSEMFPNRIRSKALSLATLALWVADFAVAATFPGLNDHFGLVATLSMYAAFCALAFLFIYRCLPETKGRSLEALEQLFSDEL